mmetsp:Transcript_26438/g.81690  ORF Transcript_26438/g.81690 Transcript_26438/m.81690 type:complete len:372 (+) Transcript_26438:76-1191(+)
MRGIPGGNRVRQCRCDITSSRKRTWHKKYILDCLLVRAPASTAESADVLLPKKTCPPASDLGLVHLHHRHFGSRRGKRCCRWLRFRRGVVRGDVSWGRKCAGSLGVAVAAVVDCEAESVRLPPVGQAAHAVHLLLGRGVFVPQVGQRRRRGRRAVAVHRRGHGGVADARRVGEGRVEVGHDFAARLRCPLEERVRDGRRFRQGVGASRRGLRRSTRVLRTADGAHVQREQRVGEGQGHHGPGPHGASLPDDLQRVRDEPRGAHEVHAGRHERPLAHLLHPVRNEVKEENELQHRAYRVVAEAQRPPAVLAHWRDPWAVFEQLHVKVEPHEHDHDEHAAGDVDAVARARHLSDEAGAVLACGVPGGLDDVRD